MRKLLRHPRRNSLKRVKEAVERAVAEERRPVTPEEGSRTAFPPAFYVDADEKGRWSLWRVVGQLRRDRPDAYNLYVGERILRDLIVDLVAEIHVERAEPLDFERLANELVRIANERSHWLLAIPLANVLPPQAYVPLDDAAAVGLTVQERDWQRWGSEPFDAFTIFNHLKDRLTAGVRWRPEGTRLGPLDTRRTAVLYLVEDGTQTMALSVGRTRARLILALWCLLSQPTHEELWPALAEWEPRPYLNNVIDHKLYEPGQWMPKQRVHGRSITEYREYTLPDDIDLLTAAVRITRAAPSHLSARAIASAAWALNIAERDPNDLERTDELLHLAVAVEALCDTGEAEGGGAKRWARLTERYGVWRELRRFYEQKELEELKDLTQDLRNITAHGSDDVLVNLGYPEASIRPMMGDRELTGQQLAVARAAAAKPVLRHAVREVTARLAREVVDRDFDDDWYRSDVLGLRGQRVRTGRAVAK
jgi:hypothetical protein